MRVRKSARPPRASHASHATTAARPASTITATTTATTTPATTTTTTTATTATATTTTTTANPHSTASSGTAPPSLLSFTAHLLGFAPDAATSGAGAAAASAVPQGLDDAWCVATKRRGVYNLFQVPTRLERLLTLGQVICVDEFLTLFTLLPLRVVIALLRALLRLASAPFRRREKGKGKGGRRGSAAEVIDVLHASLLGVTVLALRALDVSRIYHSIRGQSVIKLYVVFNVVEIFDRLCSSFGVDILDSLSWTTASAVSFFGRPVPRDGHYGAGSYEMARARALQGLALLTRVTFDYLFTLVYVIVHAGLLLTWVVTLNVAINTQNNALLTLLVSNNFVELKGSVFKSVKVANLFQIACADAVERFQLNVFLAIMLVVTSGDRRLYATWAVIYGCEVVVDWIKHAFVTKFNRIPHRIYRQFSLVICHDVLKMTQNADTRSIGGSPVSKRVGFVSLPMAALVIRMVSASVMTLPVLTLAGIFMALLGMKVGLSIGLLRHAQRKMTNATGGGSEEVREDEDRDGDMYWHQKLINVERYDLISKT